jgi:hypothetical protein
MMAMPITRFARRIALPVTAALACAWLGGCAQSVVVNAEFPAPLVERLPVRLGVVFDQELRDFEHHEEIPQAATWTVRLGDASIAMLEPLFQSMFQETREVPEMPTGTAASIGLDGIIKPTLEKFEFDVPVSGRDKFAEVWLQYRLDLYDANGELVANWPVTGYGKAELHRTNHEGSVNQAAVVAMREVGATIATKFAQQPQISYWLEERQDAAPLSVQSRTVD